MVILKKVIKYRKLKYLQRGFVRTIGRKLKDKSEAFWLRSVEGEHIEVFTHTGSHV